MTTETSQKEFDRSKLNVGSEVECFLVHSDSLREISRPESQVVLQKLCDSYGWQARTHTPYGETESVGKDLFGYPGIIKIDLCYAIFEATTGIPFSNLDEMERAYTVMLADLRSALGELGMMIWPFGVDPALSGLYQLPFKHREEIIVDNFYDPLRRLVEYRSLCHITSCQVSVDVPLDKAIPAINALYKNLGQIIETFANSPLYADGTLYKEGRFHFWEKDRPAGIPLAQYEGYAPLFPDRPFASLTDYYARLWDKGYAYVIRDGCVHTFEDLGMTVDRFLHEQKMPAVTPKGEVIQVELQKEDILLYINMNWRDFKPHYELSDFAVEDFLAYYAAGDLDGFFREFCTHSYLEIRPCSPNFEENAMRIPRYFHAIFQDLDHYIADSEAIGWEEAQVARQRALLA